MSSERLYPSSKNEQEHPNHYEANIQMPTPFLASVVAQAISVDPELRPADVTRKVFAQEHDLVISIHAKDPKSLRTSVTSLFDFIKVSLMAVAEFSE